MGRGEHVTTIAFDGKSLAADRLADDHMSVRKIFTLKDGTHVAGSGYYDQLVEVAAWLDINPS